METLKISTFSFIIVNLVDKGILQFLIAMIDYRQIALRKNHCVKSVQIWGYLWSVFSCIRTRSNSVFGHFSRSESVHRFFGRAN